MTRLLVAVPSGECADEVLALARSAAASIDAELHVVTTIPRRWPFAAAAVGIDDDFTDFTIRRAKDTLEHAKEVLGEESIKYSIIEAQKSVADALLDHAEEIGAEALVLGSAREGVLARVVLGSTTNALLHRSHVPLLLAPRGFAPADVVGFSRVTVGVSASAGDRAAVAAGAMLAAEQHVPMRVASVQVWDADMAIPVAGFDAERVVDEQWREDLAKMHAEIIDGLPEGVAATSVITHGRTWEEGLDALEPIPGEILVIGSSGQGALKRVFLGTHSNKIIRNSGIPVLVVPATEEA